MTRKMLLDKVSSDYVENGINTYLNPYSYHIIRGRKDIVEGVDSFLVDGGALKVIINRLMCRDIKRKSFDMTSMANEIFTLCVKQKKTIYFIGSNQKIIELFVSNVKRRFVGIQVAGYSHGYCVGEDRCNVVEEVASKKIDYVICGMGTPRQEEFLIDLKCQGWNGTGFTCGGFFHQSSKAMDYYPPVFNRLKLRWLYRCIDEPRLITRYLIKYPVAFFFIIKDIFSLKMMRNDR